MKIDPIEFEKEPTPICDSCAGSADRFGDRDVIPFAVARKLEKELRLLERHAVTLKALLDSWNAHADAAQMPQEFYDGYNEASMRAMQALLTAERNKSESLVRQLSKTATKIQL